MRPDALGAERPGETSDLGIKLGVGELLLASRLVPGHQRRPLVAVAQQVLGEVEAHAGEPAGGRDPASGPWIEFFDDGVGLAGDPDAAEVTDLRPEARRRSRSSSPPTAPK